MHFVRAGADPSTNPEAGTFKIAGLTPPVLERHEYEATRSTGPRRPCPSRPSRLGCARGQLDAREYSCERLARQGPALRAWLAHEAGSGARFAVLGDFNRDLLAEAADDTGSASGLWAQLQNAAAGSLINTAEHQAYRNCRIGQPHSGYIDYILLGGALRSRLVAASFERLTYSAGDAWRLKLSDHCPVSVELLLD